MVEIASIPTPILVRGLYRRLIRVSRVLMDSKRTQIFATELIRNKFRAHRNVEDEQEKKELIRKAANTLQFLRAANYRENEVPRKMPKMQKVALLKKLKRDRMRQPKEDDDDGKQGPPGWWQRALIKSLFMCHYTEEQAIPRAMPPGKKLKQRDLIHYTSHRILRERFLEVGDLLGIDLDVWEVSKHLEACVQASASLQPNQRPAPSNQDNKASTSA